MSCYTLLTFTLSSLLLALAPGPDILYVLARALTQGRRAGLVAALGFVSGLPIHSTLAALGLAVVFRSLPHALQMVQYAGAAYLLYLAVRTFCDRSAFLPTTNQPARDLRGIYFQSLTMNLLNPKVVLFFIALLPGFVPSTVSHPSVQLLVLGLIFSLSAFLVFATVACLAGTLGNLLTSNPRFATTLRYLTVVVFLALAANLMLFESAGSVR